MTPADVKLMLENQRTIMETLLANAGNYYSDHNHGRQLNQQIGRSNARISEIINDP